MCSTRGGRTLYVFYTLFTKRRVKEKKATGLHNTIRWKKRRVFAKERKRDEKRSKEIKKNTSSDFVIRTEMG